MWTAACADQGRQTPFLAVDHRRLENNIRDMADRVAGYGGRSTPHLKTHKCVEIGRLQAAAGARTATVATLTEAHLAFDAGFESVLVAYPPVPDWRATALRELTERGGVAVGCSRPEHLRALERTGGSFDIYWEVDSGAARLGTAPGEATATAIAAAAFGDRLRLRGLLTFAGHAYGARDSGELAAVRAEQDRALRDSAAALGAAPVRSVGVTPLARLESGEADEYRYGNYVFYDATQVALGGPRIEDCALAVIATVVDVPAPDRFVIDAGAKSIPAERMTSLTEGFGSVVGHPGIVLAKLYEEHGLGTASAPHGLRPGERIAIIPNHACTAVNLYHRYAVYDDSSFVETWPIRARRQ